MAAIEISADPSLGGDFWLGWRHGYDGKGKAQYGSSYERGWKMGHADRILDRSTSIHGAADDG